MKKLILLSLATLFITPAFAHEDHDWRDDYEAYLSVEYVLPLTYGPMVKRKVDPLIDMNFFKDKLAILTGNKPFGNLVITERGSTAGLDKTRAFLAAEYNALGFSTSEHKFGTGTNFIAEKKGTVDASKVLILSSHIDSVGNNGANDDGTGTIGLLAVAKELAGQDFPITIRVVGFDREEKGLVGSAAYVATLSRETIIGDIHFEMMGVNKRNDGGFHVIDCSKTHSTFMTKTMQESIAKLGLKLTVVKACTDRSDHASFWKKGLPAVVISENFFGGDADPCYHASCDKMDGRLNYPYMQAILEATLASTVTILNQK